MNTLNSMSFATRAHGRGRMVMALLIALTCALATSAWAQPGGRGHGEAAMFQGSPERVGRMIDHMLDGVSASDAQRGQVKQIAQAAAADLQGQRSATRELRERAMQVFTAPTVDANAAEAVRQQLQTQHDQSSRRIMQAMLEISRVLSPEQRAKLAERFKQRGERRHERAQRMERERQQR
jgi:periplasmic protein CpxP/Spy